MITLAFNRFDAGFTFPGTMSTKLSRNMRIGSNRAVYFKFNLNILNNYVKIKIIILLLMQDQL
jgi:hypothetical protein